MHIHLTSAGIPRFKETLDELDECHRQISSESVQKHTGLLEILKARKRQLCSIVARIAIEGALSNSFLWHLSALAE